MSKNKPYPDNILFDGKDISIDIEGKHLLQDIHLTITKNKIITIIGPNGSGKTTLARIVLGILSPDTGFIYRKPNMTIGYMPQRLTIDSLFPLTVRRFLRLHKRNKSISNDQDILNIAKQLSITHLLDQPIQPISGGEMQRVLLAKAVLAKPDLLVLDEPVQGLDLHGQTEFYQLLKHFSNDIGCGVLMISHDLHMVMAKTDHVLCINHHVCCEGSPEEITSHPEYVSLFGREDIDQVALYTHHHDHHHKADGSVSDKEDEC